MKHGSCIILLRSNLNIEIGVYSRYLHSLIYIWKYFRREMNHEEPLTLFIVCLHSGNVPEICRSRPRAFYVMSSHISMNSACS